MRKMEVDIRKILTIGWVCFGFIAFMTTTSITLNIIPELFGIVYLGAYFGSVALTFTTLAFIAYKVAYKRLNIRI